MVLIVHARCCGVHVVIGDRRRVRRVMSVVMLSDRRTVIKGERVRMGKRDRALARG